MQLDFECVDEQGACLIVGSDARREELHQRRQIENYMKSNIDSWLHYATDGLGLDLQLEDLLFVKGWAKTTHWAVAAFTDQSRSAKLHVSGAFGPVAKAGLGFEVCSNHHSAYHHVGPTGRQISGAGDNAEYERDDESPITTTNERRVDQCIFLHYFKMKRRMFFFPSRIIAAGEHQDGSSSDGSDGDYDFIEAPRPQKVGGISLSDRRQSWTRSARHTTQWALCSTTSWRYGPL